jgi:CelD/BcsL family acetyltransferase involved in cellulose biosynthesis
LFARVGCLGTLPGRWTIQYGADLFHAIAEVPGSIMLAAEHDGTLAGGFLCLRHGNRLSAWTAGIDYPRLRDLHTYGTLAYEAVSYAVDSGAAILDMGRSNHLYKQRLGLSGVDLYAAVYLAEDDYDIQASLTELHIRLIARNHAGRRP